MQYFDVFNGDADGLCALRQLRLAHPLDTTLVTGAKRDITLLTGLDARAGDRVTVLDVSFERNRDAVRNLLEAGVTIDYFDHHYAGEIFRHPLLHLHIDTAPATCTSAIMHDHLGQSFPLWAAVGAFGDNMKITAYKLLIDVAVGEQGITRLQELGEYLNYNAYGDTVAELLVHPAALYRQLAAYQNPFDFIAGSPVFLTLREHYHADMQQAAAIKPLLKFSGGTVYILPSDDWSKRVNGTFSNHLAQSNPQLAHAVLTLNPDSSYRVNVRAPRDTRFGADELCRQFPGGGGRKAAAGINHLPEQNLGAFLDGFAAAFH